MQILQNDQERSVYNDAYTEAYRSEYNDTYSDLIGKGEEEKEARYIADDNAKFVAKSTAEDAVKDWRRENWR